MKIIDDILYEMQEYLNQEVIDTGKETISDVGVGIECCTILHAKSLEVTSRTV